MKIVAKVLLLEVTLATLALGQATVSGVVYDSVARAPLRGAKIQLVPADNQTLSARTTVADSAGRFAFDAVGNGRYLIGFFHPMLDSLGVEAPLKEVNVAGPRSVSVDLAIPSQARLRVAFCRDSLGANGSGGAVIGVVRDARTRAPMPGVTIVGQWLELTIRTLETQRHVTSASATTNEIGWFRLCNVPRPGTMVLLAHNGHDSTDAVELQLDKDGFARGDLYLGSTQHESWKRVVLGDSAHVDTMPQPVFRVGDGRLSGIVLTLPERRPLAQVHVRIVGGHDAITDDRGEWTLLDAPSGTRTLEIRKIGYYPEQRTVNVIPDAPHIRVELSTMRAMLDTVRVRAIRLYDPAAADFEKRHLSLGYGKFLTPKDIEHSGGFLLSDVFRTLPGMSVSHSFGETSVLMRSIFSQGDYCSPAIFLDGWNTPGLTAADVDDIVNRENVIGIEIYRDNVPSQFQKPMRGCGSIVIWTDRTGLMAKTNASRRKPATLRTGLFFVGAALAIFLITR